MNYNFLKPVRIGQYSEDVSNNITESDENITKHVPLLLSTVQRNTLDIKFKNPNRLVFDLNMSKWFKWGMGAGGTYTWQEVNFNTNYYLYNVQQRIWNKTLMIDTNEITLDASILPFHPDREAIMVVLDGTVLTKDKHYTIETNKISCESFSGLWLAGQELSVVIYYAANSIEDSILTTLQLSINSLNDEVDDLAEDIARKNTFRIWTKD